MAHHRPPASVVPDYCTPPAQHERGVQRWRATRAVLSHVPSGLLTPDGLHGIRAHDRLAGKGLPGEHRLGIPTRNARVLGAEVQQQVRFAIPVDVLYMPLAVRFGAPCGPNSTERGSTVVALKSGVVKMATGITPLLLGLIVFGDSPGLISRVTSRAAGMALNSKAPMSQSAPGVLSPSAGRRKPRWSVAGADSRSRRHRERGCRRPGHGSESARRCRPGWGPG